MPPLQKKKRSKGKQGSKSAHRGLIAPAMTECSHCHNVRLPHRVCPSCGYYNGREVVPMDSDATT